MRADGLGLVGADEGLNLGLFDREREVVGPEMHEVLDEGRVAGQRRIAPRTDTRQPGVAHRGKRIGRGGSHGGGHGGGSHWHRCGSNHGHSYGSHRRLVLLAIGVGLGQHSDGLRRRQHRRIGRRARIVARKLSQQPAARIGRRDLARPRSKAKAVKGNRRIRHHRKSRSGHRGCTNRNRVPARSALVPCPTKTADEARPRPAASRDPPAAGRAHSGANGAGHGAVARAHR